MCALRGEQTCIVSSDMPDVVVHRDYDIKSGGIRNVYGTSKPSSPGETIDQCLVDRRRCSPVYDGIREAIPLLNFMLVSCEWTLAVVVIISLP